MIKYVIGDATNPIGEGNKIICHICNDIGGWGAGFVLAISKKWKYPEQAYRAMTKEERILGNVELIFCENTTHGVVFVANMIGQHDIKPMFMADKLVVPPIRYDAVLQCLRTVKRLAMQTQATVHMPRIGCGLAGGEWSKIEKIINEALPTIDVTVYDLK
jgi:O-acetyl-ADP-ribose deacetylase (regulator of RNase III)